jgi:polyisoprenoid-binding protein YceI
MKKLIIAATLAAALFSTLGNAANYVVDDKGAHASINFKVKHLGYSWLTGRFDKFSGKFNYDPKNISASKVDVKIITESVNSNHAKRDKHLRSADFLEVDKFESAHFTSTSVTDKGDDKLSIKGNFTLHGVTNEIIIDAYKVGEGKDPWGGYRAGFSGTTKINMKDYGFKMAMGEVLLELNIEGIMQ